MEIETGINLLEKIIPQESIEYSFRRVHAGLRRSQYLINIYGSYDKFIEDQNNESTNLRYLKEKFEEFEKYGNENIFGNYYILYNIGYINFILLWIKFFIGYFWKRKDLNILTRLYISLRKTNRVSYLYYMAFDDIGLYFLRKDASDKHIKYLFENCGAKRLCLYRYSERKKYDHILKRLKPIKKKQKNIKTK